MGAELEAYGKLADPDLVARLGSGDERALRALHRRYAALVFTVAARMVDAAAAEEIVQDVFMMLWQKHGAFDPARGSFKSWICQFARHRALNVLRGRRHDPSVADEGIEDITDDSLQPDEALWTEHRKATLRAALDALPSAQRRALSLAYFDELTQEQVARELRVPLGTTKTRIRLAMRRLGPLVAVLAGVGLLVFAWNAEQRKASREERALLVVTSSDVVPRRLEATASMPHEAHANYRVRPGGTTAVLTASHLPALGSGEHYVAWTRHDAVWFSLGEVEMRADGSSLTIAESDALRGRVDEVEITRESSVGSSPHGMPVVVWPARP
jgi:RNA polymerase sigma factor (sigma-70 family)